MSSAAYRDARAAHPLPLWASDRGRA